MYRTYEKCLQIYTIIIIIIIIVITKKNIKNSVLDYISNKKLSS